MSRGKEFFEEYATSDVTRVAVTATTVGNNTLVAAVTGKRIRVLAAYLSTEGTTPTFTFQSGAGGTGLTGAITQTSGQPINLVFNPMGWFETAAGSLLNLAIAGTGGAAKGVLIYTLVDDDMRNYT